MNTREAYNLRASAVYLLRGMGYKVAELAVILGKSKEQIRQLTARGKRKFKHG